MQGINYEGMTDEALRQLDAECSEILGRMKTRREEVAQELVRRYGDLVGKCFAAADKQSGEMTIEVGAVKLKAKIDKEVKWDSPALRAVAGSMPWELAQQIFDIKMAVPEKIYTALTGTDLKARITEARTVKYGNLKITLE